MEKVGYTLFHDISNLMLEDISWDELFESIFNIMENTISFTACTLFLYDTKKDKIIPRYKRGDKIVDLVGEFDFGKGKGIAGWVSMRQEPIVLPSLKRSNTGHDNSFASFLSIPLRIRKRLIGVLNLAHERPETYRLEYRKDYETLGNYVAVLIEKVRMKNKLEKQNKILKETLRRVKDLQERLVKKEKLAAIGEIIVTVNHEINNPLTSIINIAEILDYSLATLSIEKIRESIKVILEQSKRIKKVTHKLNHLKELKDQEYFGDIRMIKLPED